MWDIGYDKHGAPCPALVPTKACNEPSLQVTPVSLSYFEHLSFIAYTSQWCKSRDTLFLYASVFHCVSSDCS